MRTDTSAACTRTAATIPADHLAGGMRQAAMIRTPAVFLSIGFGETKRIFDAFTAMARFDPRVSRDVRFVNAACDGCDASAWLPPMNESTFASIRNTLLAPAGLNENDVQVAWMQMVTNDPFHPLPPQDADAYRLKGSIAAALRALKSRYPNLQIVYLSSRVYGGYATTSWNPEPYAYESALSVRWAIMGQVTWMRTGSLWDTRIGDLDYETGRRAVGGLGTVSLGGRHDAALRRPHVAARRFRSRRRDALRKRRAKRCTIIVTISSERTYRRLVPKRRGRPPHALRAPLN